MVNDPGRRPRSAASGASRSCRLLLILTLSLSAIVAWPAAQAPPLQINGAGATFPYPIYSLWFTEYAKVKPDVQINYLSIGSGAGIQQLTDEIVFFAASDTPMTDDELLEAPGRILQLPTVIGAVATVYNVPGVTGELRFTGDVLADIFLGRITNWNDPAIQKLNNGVTLPPTDITPIYRADGSGTSFIWSDFLSKVSPEWRRMVGATRTLRLPGGASARGSEGVSALVRQTPGAIGYVELIYARRYEMSIGLVRNAEGEFVRPSIESAAAAALAAVKQMPRDFRVSITNPPGAGAYPISSFTWLLVYESHRDRSRSREMVDFLKWAFSDGQKLAPTLGYAALPPEIVTLAVAALDRVRSR